MPITKRYGIVSLPPVKEITHRWPLGIFAQLLLKRDLEVRKAVYCASVSRLTVSPQLSPFLRFAPLCFALAASACASSDHASAGYTSNSEGASAAPQLSSFDQQGPAAFRTAKRIALVVGNTQYTAWPHLMSPHADADAMAETLERRGFTLMGSRTGNRGTGAQINVSAARFEALLKETQNAVRANPGAIVVVYYGGHGLAFGGHNFLVPVDAASPQDPAAASASAVSVAQVATRLTAAGGGIVVLFLDACRSYKTGTGGGLTAEAVPDNVFVGFAAQFGTAAIEDAQHGYYTEALLEEMDQRFGHFDDFHLAVGSLVAHRSQGVQVPTYREGRRMPEVPISLSTSDPQTQYAVERSRHSKPILLAARRCAAEGDLRLMIAAQVPLTIPNPGPFRFGPTYDPIDVQGMTNDCRAAYAAGSRDPAVLRTMSLLHWVNFRNGLPAWNSFTIGDEIELLAEAADSGDAVANLLLGTQGSSAAYGRFSRHSARDRLIVAGEGNDPFVTWYASWLLVHPPSGRPVAPQDFDMSQHLLRRAVAEGNPIAVGMAVLKAGRNDNSLSDLPLISLLDLALTRGDDFGIYLPGATVQRTLYLIAIFAAASSRNWSALAHFILPDEDFFANDLQSFILQNGRDSQSVNKDVGAILLLSACLIYSGSDPTGQPLEGVMPNRTAALTLFRQAADLGGKLQKQVLQIAQGGGDPCSRFTKR